jgi:exportin-2 (importin alpha re-exporter)
VDEDGNYMLPETEVVAIKTELIGLMISVPPSIQTQLGEAISVIADSDFWERWDTLVDVRVVNVWLRYETDSSHRIWHHV